MPKALRKRTIPSESVQNQPYRRSTRPRNPPPPGTVFLEDLLPSSDSEDSDRDTHATPHHPSPPAHTDSNPSAQSPPTRRSIRLRNPPPPAPNFVLPDDLLLSMAKAEDVDELEALEVGEEVAEYIRFRTAGGEAGGVEKASG
ncbi:hypothetical protein BJ508DRAFT_300445 [Ascobolus immersus RN42]|uniref:Uncharacterized protein n=1 Tax=Ascobolus immersus RN42 TaxID=1160509 RepID=A0A3N4IPF7_ASCIM|nr:hypothetical protein BJ508DRAFT_300445 [Ascobolus immersus RN42]